METIIVTPVWDHLYTASYPVEQLASTQNAIEPTLVQANTSNEGNYKKVWVFLGIIAVAGVLTYVWILNEKKAKESISQ